MRKSFSRTILCILILALAAQLGACAFRPRPARTSDGKILFRVGFSGEPDTLNPYAAGSEEAAAVFSLLYDTLFSVDIRTGEIIGNLCRECTVTDAAAGGKLWKMTLSSDATWHDGSRVTASDVEFSLQSAKDYSTLFGYPECELIDTTGIFVEDDTHLSMIVWGDTPYVGEFLSRVPILPRAVWNWPDSVQYGRAGIPADPVRAGQALYGMAVNRNTMMGSGLYIWDGYENGICTLRLNPEYWNGSSRAEVVELHFGMDDPSQAMEDGELDACWDLSGEDYTALSDAREWRMALGCSGRQYYVGFNLHSEAPSTGSAYLQNPVVRRAVDLCVDRDSILRDCFGGGIAEAGILPPVSGYAYEAAAFESYRAFNPSEAADALEKAGFHVRGGEKISLRLLCSDADPAWEKAALQLRETCAGAGIDLIVEKLPPGEMYARIKAWDYDLCLLSRTAYLDPFYSMGAFYWKNGDNAYSIPDDRGRMVSRGWNESGYRDDYIDAMFERMIAEENVEARKALTEQMGRYLYDNAAVVNLGYSISYQASSTVWSGAERFKGDGLTFMPFTFRQQLQGISAGGRK